VRRAEGVTINAVHKWKSNAELIVGLHVLGYIRKDDRVLDPTYGFGGWWQEWHPNHLVAHDLYTLDGVDFRDLPHKDGEFDVVAFDPPYKLNGTATPEVDNRYGVGEYASRQDRHQLIRDGIDECARVLKPKGILLIKCQDQVNGGKVRWQTREFADHAEQKHGMTLIDMLFLVGGRPQPEGRTQQHARRNYSTMLVMRR
jgi:SAM-dependent methyltransferase